MAYPITAPYQQFWDRNGDPLENGYIYIGTANLDAQGNPITVYWDAAGTIVASQPIRTLNGYPVRNGTAANIYVAAADCSIKILDKNGTLVMSKPTSRDQEFASNMLFIPAGAGAVARTSQSKMRDTISVKDFGAVGNGIVNDQLALQAAVNATPTGGELLVPPGIYNLSGVNVDGKAITIIGYGATFNCTGGTGAIIKTDHGNKLIVKGLTFTGSGSGINHTATPTGTVYDELLVEECSFVMSGGAYGIYSIGSREAVFNKCYFSNANSGNGIYFKDSVSPFMMQCLFKGTSYVGTAVNYPGTGNGTDAGLILRDTEIMGWDGGVKVIGCDWLCIEGCTIDYNNQSIKLGSQDGANISNNYIGSVGANPALWITSDASASGPNYSDKIIVINNTFTGHYTGASTYDCILIDGSPASDEIQIVNNNIHFYTRYGVNFNQNGRRLFINGNTFGQRTGFGVSPIYNSSGTGDDSVIIKDNYFANVTTISAMNLSSSCKLVTDNLGLSLNASGQVTITVGNSSVTFAHGISGYTPALSDVIVNSVNLRAATAIPYVSAIDATNCTISTVSAVAVSNAGISYQISRYKA